MGFATHETTFVNTPVEKLIGDLILGCTTLDQGVGQMLQGYRKEISLNRFYTTGDNITAPPVTGKYTVPNDSFNKDERELFLDPIAWYNEYNAREFNVDHKFLWTRGKDGMIEPSAALQSAVQPSVIENFNNTLDRMLWQGDKAGATGGSLDLIDGWEKLFNADATIIPVAPVVITAANVMATFELYIQAAAANNPAILEKSNPAFIVPIAVKYIYAEALRALPNKGVDVDQAGYSRYGGYDIIGVNGMSADTVLFGNVGGGDVANLKVGVWSSADRTSVETGRTAPQDETFFVKVNTEIGVSYVWGKELVYSKA